MLLRSDFCFANIMLLTQIYNIYFHVITDITVSPFFKFKGYCFFFQEVFRKTIKKFALQQKLNFFRFFIAY